MQQLQRAERYLKKIRAIYAGTPHVYENADFYDDDVVSFFMHCYHLRDWIAQLNCVGVKLKDVDAYINSHIELMICADFCNGEKHCKLTRKPRSEGQPHIAMRTYSVTSFANPELDTTFKARYSMLHNKNAYDVLELAEQCMQLWEVFIDNMRKFNRVRERF